jgi:xanthine dehydrogenase accessory factor
MPGIYDKIVEVKNNGQPAVLCIVTDTQGSTPRKQGAKMIVFADGTIFGTIGGGSIEKDAIERALLMITSTLPAKFSFNLEKDLGMHCGGTMEVYMEPLSPSQPLYIFGAGHIGKALAHFACTLDFRVTVIDPREDILIPAEFPKCTLLQQDFIKASEELEFLPNAYFVIVTPKHLYDEEVLARLARKPHAYLGMIGSQRKVALLKSRFLEEHILTKDEMEGIDMPIGLKMNAETPHEIAISILAKLIDIRNSKALS